MNRLDFIRWRLALWICPAINTAHGKRRLQEVARECGASRAVAMRISAVYFRKLKDDR